MIVKARFCKAYHRLMLQSFRFFLGIIAMDSFVPVVQAEKIGWHPSLGTEIGRGIDIRNPDITDQIVDLEPSEPGGATGESQITVSFSQHKLDMVKNFKLNSSLSVKGFAVNGRMGFDLVDNQNESQNSLTFSYEASRNFGDTILGVRHLKPEFVTFVNSLKGTFSGDALHRKVVEHFGSHFVTGYQKEARVVVLYTFEIGSRTRVQQLNASLQARYGVSEFNSTVQSLFSEQENTVRLNYKFWSSDPVDPAFAITGSISNYEEFLQFTGQVDAYWRGMDPARAKIMSWIVQPLQSTLAYLALLDGYTPADPFEAGYDRFITAFARLASWEKLLSEWTMDPRRMNWMNANGQKAVLGIRTDASRMRERMKTMADEHFNTGAPLIVPDDILNYFVNFNRLPLPAIYHLGRADFGEASVFGVHNFGWISCGSQELTVENPFFGISHKFDGLETPDFEQIVYSAADFERITRQRWQGFPTDAPLNALFTSPRWIALSNLAAIHRIGFFESSTRPSLSSRITFALRDLTGDSIDELNFNSSRSGGIVGAALESSNLTGIQSTANWPSQAIVGTTADINIIVTNSGPGAAYGITLGLPINGNRFEFRGVSGSQGFGGVTNGVLTYIVGPLGLGSAARITLRVVPLDLGGVSFGDSVTVNVGDGLADPNLADNFIVLRTPTVTAPKIGIEKRDSDRLEVSWSSDTDRLGLQFLTAFSLGNDWRPFPVTPVILGKRRSVSIPPAESQTFFRLKAMP